MHNEPRIRILLACEIHLNGKLVLTSRDGELRFAGGVSEEEVQEALRILERSNRIIQTAYDRLWKKFGPQPQKPQPKPKPWER
jgi:hypothetical protein